MADSGQRQTAVPLSSDVHTFVDDILEMLSDMTMRKIDISSDQRYFNVLLHEMTNVPAEVSAERLRKVMARLKKKSEQISPHNASNAAAAAPEEVSAERMRNGIQAQAAPLQKKSVQISLHNASNAAAAGKRACSAPTSPTAAIGHGHSEDEDERSSPPLRRSTASRRDLSPRPSLPPLAPPHPSDAARRAGATSPLAPLCLSSLLPTPPPQPGEPARPLPSPLPASPHSSPPFRSGPASRHDLSPHPPPPPVLAPPRLSGGES